MRKVKVEDINIIARQSDQPIKECQIPIPQELKNAIKDQWREVWPYLMREDVHPLDKLKEIYSIADKYLLDVKKKAVCQKGCAHCCRVDVGITLIEAWYISNKYGLWLNDISKPLGNDYFAKKQYCNFLDLDTGECKIYEHRPLACRSFFTLDHYKFCENDQQHGIYAIQASDFLLILSKNLLDFSSGRYADIRDWFGLDKEGKPPEIEWSYK